MMTGEPICCEDVRVPECCWSCHHDEDLGYDSLWQESWLHVCCAALIHLRHQGVDPYDEKQVRAFVAAAASGDDG